MTILIDEPWLALIPFVGFLVVYAASKRFIALAAATAWLVYLPYEYAMKLRVLCSGECNIRIDLLVLYPALMLVSLAASVVSAVMSRTRIRIAGCQRS